MSDPEQLNLVDYVHDLDDERRKRRKSHRSNRRTFIVFATDPSKAGQVDYKLTFATEAASQAEAERKVREVVNATRRVVAYLASGKYGQQLPEARWVA